MHGRTPAAPHRTPLPDRKGGLRRASTRALVLLALAATSAAAVTAASAASAATGRRRRPGSEARPPATKVPITHVIEIMLENHTFDDLFAHFHGARGLPAGTTFADPDEYFVSMPRVPPVVAPPNEGDVYGGINNSRIAEKMAMDYEPGKGYLMDGYTRFPADGLASVTSFPPNFDPNLQYLASHYELADMNFQPAIAPTGPNVEYALAATAGGFMYNDAPPPADAPHDSIFDELSRAHRSWNIYYGVPPTLLAGSLWSDLVPAGTPLSDTGRAGSTDGISTVSQFLSDLSGGTLPDFSFVRPGVGYSEEPPEDVGEGDAWLGQLVSAVGKSRYWRSSVIFVTYDEGGGFYDHVRPPITSEFGYGTRTPMVIVSPWARRGVYRRETTNMSVLAFMQHLWGLSPLTRLNARQDDLLGPVARPGHSTQSGRSGRSGAFDFAGPPLRAPAPPVRPRDTIGFYGPSPLSDVTDPLPGAAVTIHVQANTAGLALDPRVSGRVSLSCIPPRGVAVPAGFPSSVALRAGKASFRTSFRHPGYYRIEAKGPGPAAARIVGWTTLDVGVGPDTP